jgi:3-oxoacyl-[acyl-carrier protein] reductase
MLGKGAVAILTGAGRLRGVGAATARLLATRGCHLILNCLKNVDQAEQVAAECRTHGIEVEVMQGDLSQAPSCATLAKLAEKRFGKVDILVNCLGATKSASYEKLDALSAEDFARLFAINATAPYLITQALQPLLMKSDRAAIVNVSSAAGITGKGSSIAYAAAKGAENTLTLALAQALAPHVRVNVICPSFIDSSWWEEAYAGKEEKYAMLLKTMRENNVLGKVLTPEDVAKAIVSVIDNPAITGEIIRLDCGAHLGKYPSPLK